MPISVSRLATTVAVVAAATLPTTALAMAADLRSPDAKDAAAAPVGHTTRSGSGHAGITSRAIPQRDLRSPDARDAALRALRPLAATEAGCSTLVRSLSPEDAAARQWRCAGAASTSSPAATTGGVDVRSPDARDAARRAEAGQQSAPPVAVPVARSASASPAVAASDTDNTTAAIIAGGAAGVLLLGLAWLLASRRRDAAQRDRTLVPH